MSVTERSSRMELRRLPPSAKQAMAGKTVRLSAEVARSQFSRTFADVLSGRFGGRWSVEWRGPRRAASQSAPREAHVHGRRENQ
jgi:hypothetical protein